MNIVVIDYLDTYHIFHIIGTSLICYLGGSPDQLMKSVKQAHRSVRQVKSEFQMLRAVYSRQLQSFEHYMKYSCSQVMSHIRTAHLNTGKCCYHIVMMLLDYCCLVNPSSSLRMKRLEVEPEEEAYHMRAQETFNDFRLVVWLHY